MMPKDREGKILHIKDVCEWEEERGVMGEVEKVRGTLIAFLSSEEIELQDLEGGLPVIKKIYDVERVESLIGELEEATTRDEFLSIVEKMEARYEGVVESKAAKKKSPKKKKPEGPSLFD